MNNKLLYYPYINVPKADWTKKATLFYDEVSTIAPYEFIENPKYYDPITKQYFDSGLVRPLDPNNTRINIYSVNRDIINVVHSPSFNLKKRRRRFQLNQRGKIHSQKFTGEIFSELRRLKICTPKDKEGWFYVEKHTANLMMLYLTTAVAISERLTPSTDQKYNINQLFTGDYDIKKADIKYVILNETIPYPRGANPYQIARFKENYFESLKNYREFIEEEARKLSLYENIDVRKEETQKRIADINERRDELIARMRESKLKRVIKGSFVPAMIATSLAYKFESLVPFLGLTLVGAANYGIMKFTEDGKIGGELNYLGLIDKKLKYST